MSVEQKWRECRAGCCFHKSDEVCYTSNPPHYDWIETCCTCGQRWLVKSVPKPEPGHGPYANPALYYHETREPLP